MATFVFWNIKQNPNPDLIRTLCREQDADVLALAEIGAEPSTFLPVANRGVDQQFYEVESPAKRVRMFSRLPAMSVQLISDTSEASIRHIRPPIGLDAILVAVHLPSKLFMSEIEQALHTTRLVRAILDAENRIGHSRMIVMGDLNMNPFEPGVVGADALHAIMHKRIAREVSRTVNGERRQYFYNPMWTFFGNGDLTPPGTYYRKDNSQICYLWNIFDQILIRPDLLDRVSDDDVKVVHRIGSTSLITSRGTVDDAVSDHLPIAVTVQLERVSNA